MRLISNLRENKAASCARRCSDVVPPALATRNASRRKVSTKLAAATGSAGPVGDGCAYGVAVADEGAVGLVGCGLAGCGLALSVLASRLTGTTTALAVGVGGAAGFADDGAAAAVAIRAFGAGGDGWAAMGAIGRADDAGFAGDGAAAAVTVRAFGAGGNGSAAMGA